MKSKIVRARFATSEEADIRIETKLNEAFKELEQAGHKIISVHQLYSGSVLILYEEREDRK
jgi:hypothetical protein